MIQITIEAFVSYGGVTYSPSYKGALKNGNRTLQATKTSEGVRISAFTCTIPPKTIYSKTVKTGVDMNLAVAEAQNAILMSYTEDPALKEEAAFTRLYRKAKETIQNSHAGTKWVIGYTTKDEDFFDEDEEDDDDDDDDDDDENE